MYFLVTTNCHLLINRVSAAAVQHRVCNKCIFACASANFLSNTSKCSLCLETNLSACIDSRRKVGINVRHSEIRIQGGLQAILFDVPANITKKSCYNILQKRFFIRGFSLHFFSIEVGSETNVDHYYIPVADEIKVSWRKTWIVAVLSSKGEIQFVL